MCFGAICLFCLCLRFRFTTLGEQVEQLINIVVFPLVLLVFIGELVGEIQ
jgi:hypothetical protein